VLTGLAHSERFGAATRCKRTGLMHKISAQKPVHIKRVGVGLGNDKPLDYSQCPLLYSCYDQVETESLDSLANANPRRCRATLLLAMGQQKTA
jgi:hypothetical protein